MTMFFDAVKCTFIFIANLIDVPVSKHKWWEKRCFPMFVSI